MTHDAIPLLVFLPLLAATAAAVLPAWGGRMLALGVVLVLPVLLYGLTLEILSHGALDYELAGLATPLGIRLHLDGFSLLMLWLVATVMLGATLHACSSIGADRDARRFWATWLVLLVGLNTLFLSADLFNLYVGLELLTIAAVALVAFGGGPESLRAAMRYLLLAMLASMTYLLGVALVYGATGTLDLALVSDRMAPGPLQAAALVLMTGGLLLKAAIFPLHGWLPPAHASARGPVSAVLSALVVKAALYILIRLWFEGQPALPPAPAGTLMAALGAGAILVGSLLALMQRRLKRLIAYSTVAQLGYVMLLFDVPSAVVFEGALYQIISHGLAKAAMFLAAANLIRRLGNDRLNSLPGADREMPLSALAFGLAGISLMGLPPSGGFLAKWLLLSGAWAEQKWWILAVVLVGSLLAAAYVFRVLGLMFRRPAGELGADSGSKPSRLCELTALALALLAIAAGFASEPILALLSVPASLAGGTP